MFKLYYAPTSPFVRKVMITAWCLGINDQIEMLESAAHPIQRDARIARFNPLAKIPAFQTVDGQFLYDSRVICEYLNAYAQGGLFPVAGNARWTSLTRQALGDGLLDAALLARYERTVRPEEKQWAGWVDAQLQKVSAALDEIEKYAEEFSRIPDDIGLITLGCALGYLDFRFADLVWRNHHPLTAAWFAEFDQHPAMVKTRPVA